MRSPHLIIVDYQEAWPEMFEAEKQRILQAVGSYIATVEHIGSTSVPGLAAKPVIDILIGVHDLAVADKHCIRPIVALGYEYVDAYEDQMPDRRYFRQSDAGGMRTHHIHLWPHDHLEYERHIVFRDYLRAHPAEADAYAKLKRELIGQFDSGNAYAEAKSVFIKPAETRAFAWKRRQEEQHRT
jgi:GrpB-like predicted nucleotidyltransferase (UPF0157 family)